MEMISHKARAPPELDPSKCVSRGFLTNCRSVVVLQNALVVPCQGSRPVASRCVRIGKRDGTRRHSHYEFPTLQLAIMTAMHQNPSSTIQGASQLWSCRRKLLNLISVGSITIFLGHLCTSLMASMDPNISRYAFRCWRCGHRNGQSIRGAHCH